MPPTGYFIDTNLFVLFVVGSEDRDLIPKHRRLERYSERDYDLLIDLLDQADQILVTPNTLTETSNLLGQHGEPERSRLFQRLRAIIQESKEIVVASAVASSNSAFERLGLTDAALLELATAETPVVTVDFTLYLAALAKGEDAAVNFTHLRDL
jgi:uncharacterized protein with PIN domain